MKKTIVLLCATMLMGGTVTLAKEKKDKKEKEKKEYVWDWDGKLSGEKDVDTYLTDVDTLWNEIIEFKEKYSIYTYYQDTLLINDKVYLMAYMRDNEGNYVTRGTVNWQFAGVIADGSIIVLSATNAALGTALATASLPALGLDAFKFGKYIKGGPKVIAMGMKEIKNIWMSSKENARTWKSLKNAAIDPSNIGYFSENALKTMNRCCYIKEVMETDPSYEAIVTKLQQKSQDEITTEAAKAATQLAEAIVLPEDKSKSLDDISDEDFEKALEG